jgi:hypothetical protein
VGRELMGATGGLTTRALHCWGKPAVAPHPSNQDGQTNRLLILTNRERGPSPVSARQRSGTHLAACRLMTRGKFVASWRGEPCPNSHRLSSTGCTCTSHPETVQFARSSHACADHPDICGRRLAQCGIRFCLSRHRRPPNTPHISRSFENTCPRNGKPAVYR